MIENDGNTKNAENDDNTKNGGSALRSAPT